jgi:hypothetical protein
MRDDMGDPASTSALGGALRSQALHLASLLEQLDPGRSRGQRAAPTADRFDVDHERRLIEAVAEELDKVGSALQATVSGGVERAARRRALAVEAGRFDLELDGQRVIERSGPSRVDPARREHARVHLQELLGRLVSAQGRELGGLTRELDSSMRALALLSERARDGAG